MSNRKIVLACSVCIAMLMTSCGAKKKDDAPKTPPPTAVTTEVVKKEKAVYYDQYPATVAALNQVDLKAQVTGYITGIYFNEGEHVTKGQKLYDIDRQQYQANLDQAIANENVAKSNVERAQQDADRYADLFKQDAIAKQVYDHALADLQSARMQMEAARSNVRNVQATFNYSFIYAPFSGTIGISLVKKGALATANQTLLNTISSDDPMAVDIEVDQKEIPRFVQLQQNGKAIADSIITLQVAGMSLYPQSGKVSFIDRAVDPQTGTIKARLVFANSNKMLKSGMNVNVSIKNSSADSLSLIIPYKAVTEQMGEYFVYAVTDSNIAIQHKLSLGARINDKVVVTNGLKEGDEIVTEGFQKLKDSSKVQVTPKPQ